MFDKDILWGFKLTWFICIKDYFKENLFSRIFCSLFLFSVKLAKSAHNLFGFSVSTPEGGRRYYQYNRLPFGVSTAVYLVEQLTRPIKSFCLMNDVSLSIYIDDGIVVHKTKKACQAAYNFSIFLLLLGGWELQLSKCISEPSQTILYLGYFLNSKDLTISVPQSKCDKVIKMITDLEELFYAQSLVKNKRIAQLCGLLAHCYYSHGAFVSVVSRLLSEKSSCLEF